MSPEGAPRGQVVRAALPAAVLLCVGALSLLGRALFFEPEHIPGSDWGVVAAGALERSGPRDAARVYPAWDDRLMVHLGGFGERLVTERDLVPEDTARLDAVWVITSSSQVDAALAAFPFEAEEGERVSSGEAVAIRVDVPGAHRARARLRELLREAKVERVGAKGEVESCSKWDERLDGWTCGKRDKVYHVGRTFRDVGDEVRPCIWAHPPKGEATWRVTFPEVELHDRFVLRASPTMRGWRRSKEGKGEVSLIARVGDEVLVDRQVPMREYGWDAYETETTSRRGERVEVVVEVSSKVAKERQFCFDGWVY